MINVNNIFFSYDNSKNFIIEDLSIHIPKGSYVNIIGSNGSCKTTLIKLILNLLTPQKGSIHIDANHVSYVPQKNDTFNSSFPITVGEILNTHRKVLKIKEVDVIDKALKKVEMLSYKNSLIGNLSGGQQQKIFIARALLMNSDLLILDEPSTALDAASISDVYKTLRKLNLNNNVTILSVEHDLDKCLDNATHILKMENNSGNLYTTQEYLNTICTTCKR